MSDQCDYNSIKGNRCKLPPRHWIFTGRYQTPRKVCASHVNSEVNGGISPDAPDRTEEYMSSGYVRIEVDEEYGYTRLLGDLLGIPFDAVEFHAPRYVWIRIE